jgi:inorganic pyrophosphatase
MPGYSHALDGVPAFDPKTGLMNVVVETPRGHRNKYKYDRELQAMKLDTVMPAGVVFPLILALSHPRWGKMATRWMF